MLAENNFEALKRAIDERNEYHGVTLERAARILEMLGVELRSHAEALREEMAA